MAKIMVIGASGFLGREVLPAYAAGHQVVGLSRRGGPGVEAVDIRDRSALAGAVARHAPDAVILLAAYRDPDRCEEDAAEARRLNVEPARTLCDVLPARTHLLFTSTDYVFDGEQPPYREEHRPHPINVYGQTKVEAENLLASRPRSVVLRIPLLIGGGATLADSGFIGQMVQGVRERRRQLLDDVLMRFPTWTRDVAGAARYLTERGAEGLYHLSGPRGGTRYAWTVELARLLGLPHDHLEPSRAVVARKAGRPRDSQLADERLRAFGFGRRTDFADVVRTVLRELGEPAG